MDIYIYDSDFIRTVLRLHLEQYVEIWWYFLWVVDEIGSSGPPVGSMTQRYSEDVG